MYVVVRRGVYDQGVIDVCSTIPEAKKAAEAAAAKEHDLYHEFEIRGRDPKFQDFSDLLWQFGAYNSGPKDDKRTWKEIE